MPRQCGRSWACLPILHCQPTIPAQGPAGALLGFLCLPVSGHVLLMISRHGPVSGSLSSATVRRVLCPVGKLPCKVTGNPRKEGESLLVPLIASQRPIPSPPSPGHHGVRRGVAGLLEEGVVRVLPGALLDCSSVLVVASVSAASTPPLQAEVWPGWCWGAQ